jgi:hypothetical protein
MPRRARLCPWCTVTTLMTFYDDYRPGKPYAYYQC